MPIFKGNIPPIKTEITPTSGNKLVANPDCVVFMLRISVKKVGSHPLKAVYWNNTPASAASNSNIARLLRVSLIILRGGEGEMVSLGELGFPRITQNIPPTNPSIP